MTNAIRPRIIVSQCLEHKACRYNGEVIQNSFVNKLKGYVDFLPVCPELAIGLGVPRAPIRIVSVGGELRLVQPATAMDVSDRMRVFTDTFLESVSDADGFILKSRSPSCGPRDVKVYPDRDKVSAMARTTGFFGGAVMKRFGHLAVEDEGRLNNFNIREHFLTKVYCLARFRAVKAANSMNQLVQFQTSNKFLLLAYHQKELRELGRIVANAEKKPITQVLDAYGQHLYLALQKLPRMSAVINVLLHGLGYFSKQLSPSEKAFFLDTLEKYRQGKVPSSVLLHLIKSWIVRFHEEYLAQQSFFAPYPEAFIEITDSGKGRDLD